MANPVSNPTWYADIRNMFTSEAISHMRPIGFDLADYDFVRTHSGQIYEQVAGKKMPPGNPWPQEWIDTFLNWMNTGYPKGTPVTSALFRSGIKSEMFDIIEKRASRIRKEVTMLTAAEVTLLTKAFNGLINKPNDDPDSYFTIAGYHWLPEPNLYCMHHEAGFNPWHRAHLLRFENALRSIPGCETVTLPYWDISTSVPSLFKNGPFDSYTFPADVGPEAGYRKGDKTSRYTDAIIQQNLQTNGVVTKLNYALSQTDWVDFHGLIANSLNIAFISAHDNGHGSIGDTMADQDISAFDPMFWFYHCNLDRIWWEWQKKMGATDLNGLLSTIGSATDPLSYQIFSVPSSGAINPFTTNAPHLKAADVIDSVTNLDVDYANLPTAISAPVTVTRTILSSFASEKMQVNTNIVNVRVKGLNRLKIPGTFTVHLLRDDKVIASTTFFQPNEVQKCATCVKNAIVHFDFELPMEEVSKGKLGIWVEPRNKTFVGNRFPNKLMGNPTVEVSLLLSVE